MKNNNFLIITLFIALSLINLSASSIELSQNNLLALQNKVWCLNNDASRHIKFSNTDIIAYLDGNEISRSTYHLSTNNCQTSNFDSSKVGTILNGQYLLTEFKCYSIRFIDNNLLEMSLVENDSIAYTIVYKVKI